MYTLKLPVIIHHQTQKACNNLSSQEFEDAKDKAKVDLNWIKCVIPVELVQLMKTIYKKWQPGCSRKSKEATGIEQGLSEELLQ